MAVVKCPTATTAMENNSGPVHQSSDGFVTLNNEGASGLECDDFVGAKLELSKSEKMKGSQPGADLVGVESELTSPGLNRHRPGSTFGRASAASTASITSTSATKITTDRMKDLFFSKKPGAFENAVEWCRGNMLKSDIDGELTGAWLLAEIDHWDHEREKVILITEKTILIVSYDFVTSKFKDIKRIFLHQIKTIEVGDFNYPPNSLMSKIQPRDHGGIRIHWGDLTNLTFGQKWNPFSTDLPFTTFSHHPLLYNPKEKETVTFNVDDFYESLLQAVRQAMKVMAPEEEVAVKEGPIVIESYLSVSSVIYNQSFLGFNKDRNGVSF